MRNTDEGKLNRAELARQVLENPVYQEALVMIKASLVESLSKTNTRHTTKLQDMTRTLQNLDRLEKVLERFYSTGKVVQEKRKIINFK
jgi:hypothetical protein